MSDERFDTFLDHIERRGIASRSALVGCSAEEIAALEHRNAVTLPKSYRRYLRTMGHKSGRLFTHDHAAVFYPYVLEMTAQQREARRARSQDGVRPLPADALIIMGRLGEQFELIRCADPDDSPVWYYNTTDWEPKQEYATVLDWLYSFATEAERAIADGYFETYPNGTVP